MAIRFVIVASIAALLACGCGDRVANVTGGAGPTQRSVAVAQGKHVVIATMPLDQVLVWSNHSGIRTGYVSPKGTYHAPLALPPGQSDLGHDPGEVLAALNGSWAPCSAT